MRSLRVPVESVIPSAVALVALVAAVTWVHSYIVAPSLPERAFGFESPPLASVVSTSPSTAGISFFNKSINVQPLQGEWPGFRGAARDNVSRDPASPLRQWGPGGPRVLWSVRVGEGYAGPAVENGRVYLLDYDQAAHADALRCFTLSDGSEIWRRSYPSLVKRNHGMSRTVPAVHDKSVVSLGPKCQVLCADAATGAVRWQCDLVHDYGATVPEWYTGQCPLIDGDRVIVAPGGPALMVALDLTTGRLLWRSPNPSGWLMTHSSIVPVTVEGVRMYVYCGSGGVAGISAKDGAILWSLDTWKIETATVPSPVDVGGGRLFLSGGYNAGSMMIQISRQGGAFTARTIFRLPAETFGSDQQTPIYYKGYIYGVIPGGQLACLDPSGRSVWTSGPMHRFGLGAYVIAGGLIYLMNDKGVLTVVEPGAGGYAEVAQGPVFADGQDCWGPLAPAGGRLIVRNLTQLSCLEIGQP